jgi:V8-like Glu-specific endopeptidase
MYGGHSGSFVIAKQNRQTIGHHHGASHAELLGKTPVRLEPIRRLFIDF